MKPFFSFFSTHLLFCSWFLETIEFYSPIVLIQLISSMIMLATMAFYLDLVFIWNLYWPAFSTGPQYTSYSTKFYSNFNILVLIFCSCWAWLCSHFSIYLSIVILENWPPTAMRWCLIVCFQKWNGANFCRTLKRMSFW